MIFTKGRLIGKRAKEVRNELFELTDQSNDQNFQNDELPESSLSDDRSNSELNENNKRGKKVHKELADTEQTNDTDFQNEELKKSNADVKKGELEQEAEISLGDLSLTDDSSISMKKSDSSDENQSIDVFDEKFDKYENCDGVNEDGPSKSRKMHRSQSSILNAEQGVNQCVPCLPNGHISTVGVPNISTRGTCTFDAIFQYYAVCYSDIPSTKQKIDRNDGSNVCELIRLLFTGKEHKILNNRNTLLHKLCIEKIETVSKRQFGIDCFSTVNYMFQKMSQNDNARHTRTCDKCGTEDYTYVPYVPINSIGFDIKNVQAHIRDLRCQNDVTCEKCNSPIQTKSEFNKVVLMETDVTDESNESLYTKFPPCLVNEITNSIELLGWKFNLGGIICHRGGHGTGSHFFLYAKRTNGIWEKYDDIFPKHRCVAMNTPIEVAGLFYTFDASQGNVL